MFGNLRCVDSQKPHGVGRAVGERDDHRVTVEHLDDPSLRRRNSARLTEPPSSD
jgi:hypothetical protein